MRLTVAQALVKFLAQQYVVDAVGQQTYRQRLIPGMMGIFGHGNVAGIGQALKQYQTSQPHLMPYYQGRNEQAQVSQAVGYARHMRRRATFAVTTSVGPGATNMLTGAALATTNRLPALLLPADVFATRVAEPVLQQLERYDAGDLSVNDAFRPLSVYFDRIVRAEQLPSAVFSAMRALTDPAMTGAVTLCFPQDVQAEAWDFPQEFFAEREWRIRRPDPESDVLSELARRIRSSRRPLIVAGGGVLYAFAEEQLRTLVETTGIPVASTQAGMGVLPWDHAQSLGAIGATGTSAANRLAAESDLIIGIGTRYEDFTTASKTLFQNPQVQFANINVATLDAYKNAASLPLVADAHKTLLALTPALTGYRISDEYAGRMNALKRDWTLTVDQAFAQGPGPDGRASQNAIIGAVNDSLGARDVLVCAAGSLPGDLHKMWRVRDAYGYHVEYAYSCMGYEIAGGLGVKRAVIDKHARGEDALREVIVMVGDGSYLMLHTELVTAVAERIKLIVVLIQNHGYASIGALSESLGSQRFGTQYRHLDALTHSFDEGEILPVDLAANAASLGVRVVKVNDVHGLREALTAAKNIPEENGPVLIHIEADPLIDAPDSESWWDVPVAETAELESTCEARMRYIRAKKRQRPYL